MERSGQTAESVFISNLKQGKTQYSLPPLNFAFPNWGKDKASNEALSSTRSSYLSPRVSSTPFDPTFYEKFRFSYKTQSFSSQKIIKPLHGLMLPPHSKQRLYHTIKKSTTLMLNNRSISRNLLLDKLKR